MPRFSLWALVATLCLCVPTPLLCRDRTSGSTRLYGERGQRELERRRRKAIKAAPTPVANTAAEKPQAKLGPTQAEPIDRAQVDDVVLAPLTTLPSTTAAPERGTSAWKKFAPQIAAAVQMGVMKAATSTGATADTAEEAAEEKIAEETLSAKLARIEKGLNSTGALTFAGAAQELEGLLGESENRTLIEADHALQTKLLTTVLIDLATDDEVGYDIPGSQNSAVGYDIPGPYNGSEEEKQDAYKAGLSLFTDLINRASDLLRPTEEVRRKEQEAAAERAAAAGEKADEDSGGDWFDDDHKPKGSQWFTREDEGSSAVDTSGGARQDPSLYGPALQRRKDAFAQMLQHWRDDEAAAALQKLFAQHLPQLHKPDGVASAVGALYDALQDEDTRDLIGKHPHLRRHIFDMPRHNRRHTMGVLYRHVPALDAQTLSKYLLLIELLQENPNDTGQESVDKATRKLIKEYLRLQVGFIEAATTSAKDDGEVRAAEPVGADALKERQDPLGGKDVLIVTRPHDSASTKEKELFETLEGARLGMHGSDIEAFIAATKIISKTISGRMYGVIGDIKKSEALKSLLADLLLVPLQRDVIAELADTPYDNPSVRDEEALAAGIELFEKVIKKWADLLGKPKKSKHDDFDRWLVDIERRRTVFENPLDSDSKATFGLIVGWCQKLLEGPTLAEGARDLAAFLEKDGNRKHIGGNPWMHAYFMKFFLSLHVDHDTIPPLSRGAKEAYLALLDRISDNPRDLEFGPKNKMMQSHLTSLREAVEARKPTDEVYTDDRAEEVDDGLRELGNFLYTVWPPTDKPLVARRKGLQKNFESILKLLAALEDQLEKKSFRNSIATEPTLRDHLAHIVLATQPAVPSITDQKQKRSADDIVAQIEGELAQEQKKKIAEQLVDIVAELEKHEKELNLNADLKKLLKPQRLLLYRIIKPLDQEAQFLYDDLSSQWRRLLKTVGDGDAKGFGKELARLFASFVEEESKRSRIGDFPLIRETFFSFFFELGVPEGISVGAEQTTEAFLRAIESNPRNFGYNNSRSLHRRIRKHIAHLRDDLEDRQVSAALSKEAQTIVDALEEHVPQLTDAVGMGEAAYRILRALRKALEADPEVVKNYPNRVRKRLFSSKSGIFVLRDIPEDMDDLNKSQVKALIQFLLKNLDEFGLGDDEFIEAKLEKLQRDLDDKQKADIAAREAAKKAAEDAEAAKEAAEDAAEDAEDEAQRKKDAALSLSGSSGSGGDSKDDISIGGGHRGGTSGNKVFDYDSARRKARAMPWFRQSSPPAGAPKPDKDMLKNDWAMSVYNYLWPNIYKFYYGGEIATFIKGVDDAISTSKFKSVLALAGIGKRKSLRDNDQLAKIVVYYLAKLPEELPIIPDPEDQKIVADFYEDILDNKRMFETHRTNNSIELKNRLEGILRNITETGREQMLEGLPPAVRLPLKYNPRLVNTVADALFERSTQRLGKQAMAQSMVHSAMMPGMMPGMYGQGNMMAPGRMQGRRGPYGHFGGPQMMPPVAYAQPPMMFRPPPVVYAPPPPQPVYPASPLMLASQRRVQPRMQQMQPRVNAMNAFQQAGQRRQAHRASQAFGGARAGAAPPPGMQPPPQRPPQQEAPSKWKFWKKKPNPSS